MLTSRTKFTFTNLISSVADRTKRQAQAMLGYLGDNPERLVQQPEELAELRTIAEELCGGKDNVSELKCIIFPKLEPLFETIDKFIDFNNIVDPKYTREKRQEYLQDLFELFSLIYKTLIKVIENQLLFAAEESSEGKPIDLDKFFPKEGIDLEDGEHHLNLLVSDDQEIEGFSIENKEGKQLRFTSSEGDEAAYTSLVDKKSGREYISFASDYNESIPVDIETKNNDRYQETIMISPKEWNNFLVPNTMRPGGRVYDLIRDHYEALGILFLLELAFGAEFSRTKRSYKNLG